MKQVEKNAALMDTLLIPPTMYEKKSEYLYFSQKPEIII